MDRQDRLLTESNLWVATVRPDGRPHLAPVWFVWLEGHVYICTGRSSVKARNLLQTGKVTIALESGLEPIVAECQASLLARPYPAAVVAAFQRKYEWDIVTDAEYNALFEFSPQRWVMG